MTELIQIDQLSKIYDNGFQALDTVSLSIKKGEILALLGPNGAGKTTLISIICGLVNSTSGSVQVAGYDIINDFRQTRAMIGLVPQELTNNHFDSVISTVSFTRGLFGKPRNDGVVEQVLRDLSLWDKRENSIGELSGGMKRRVLIAKALAHEPDILFLDEPTAGVDVELRQDMWRLIHRLREKGVTIILTTHYIEEAEEMADRIGVINQGKLMLVEEKSTLIQRLGTKELHLDLVDPLNAMPVELATYSVRLEAAGKRLIYSYDSSQGKTGITALMQCLSSAGVRYTDIKTEQSSLEQIFIGLVKEGDLTKTAQGQAKERIEGNHNEEQSPQRADQGEKS